MEIEAVIKPIGLSIVLFPLIDSLTVYKSFALGQLNVGVCGDLPSPFIAFIILLNGPYAVSFVPKPFFDPFVVN